MTETPNPDEQTEARPVEAAAPDRPVRWRQRTAIVMVVIASILAPIAVDAVFIKDTALNTDNFVSRLAPLSTDPAVQAALADEVSKQILDKVDLNQRLGEVLPKELSFLSGPLDNTLNQFVHRTALRITSSKQFSALWEKTLRYVHSQLTALLTGQTKRIKLDNGTVSLDLTALRDRVVTKLDGYGLGKVLKVDTSKPLVIKLFKSEKLAKGQLFVRLLKFFGWFAPLLVLLLFAAALALATRRRRIVLGIGVGLVIGMLVHLIGLAFGESLYLKAVVQVLPRDAAESVFNLLMKFPRSGTWAMLALGAVLTLAAMAFGPGPKAIHLRAAVSGLFGRAGTAGGEAAAPLAAVGRFVNAYRTAFRVVVIVAGLLFLALARPSSGARVLWTTLAVLVVLAIVEILAAAGRVPPAVEAPAADEVGDDGPAGTRDEVPAGRP